MKKLLTTCYRCQEPTGNRTSALCEGCKSNIFTMEQDNYRKGNRKLLGQQRLQTWLGEDDYEEKVEELALDIINGIYAVEDVLRDIAESHLDD